MSVNVSGSVGLMPTTRLDRSRLMPNAVRRPRPTPKLRSLAPCPKIIQRTVPVSAPNAILSPISFLRWDTE